MNQIQQELSTVLFSEIGEIYYENPDFQLAPKTFCARAFSHISNASVTLHKKSLYRFTHGLIDVAIGTLYAVNALFALVEAVAALAVTALLVRTLSTYAIKTLACAFHSALTIKVQVQAMYNLNFPRYYSDALVDSEINHHLATASAHWMFLHGQKKTGRFHEIERIPFISAVRFFVTKEPMVDLLKALYKDFNPGLSNEEITRTIQTQSFLAFLANRRDVFEFFKECCEDFDRLLDSQFQSRLRDVAADFVRFSQTHVPHAAESESGVQIMDATDARDGVYQKQLQKWVKDAFLEIYKDDILASYLSAENTAEAGREALEGYAAGIYLPLANYAQLKELEASVVACPEKFYTYKLQAEYSGRKIHIELARKLLAKVTAVDKKVLISRLISCKEPQAKPSLEILFKNISALAGSLHGGSLMSQQTIQEWTAHISSNNLFQKACMDAMSVIR